MTSNFIRRAFGLEDYEDLEVDLQPAQEKV